MISEAWRAYRSLYIPSQSIGTAEEDDTRCSGDDEPLLLLLVADTAVAATLDAEGTAAAAAFSCVQWEQPGCGSGNDGSAAVATAF